MGVAQITVTPTGTATTGSACVTRAMLEKIASTQQHVSTIATSRVIVMMESASVTLGSKAKTVARSSAPTNAQAMVHAVLVNVFAMDLGREKIAHKFGARMTALDGVNVCQANATATLDLRASIAGPIVARVTVMAMAGATVPQGFAHAIPIGWGTRAIFNFVCRVLMGSVSTELAVATMAGKASSVTSASVRLLVPGMGNAKVVFASAIRGMRVKTAAQSHVPWIVTAMVTAILTLTYAHATSGMKMRLVRLANAPEIVLGMVFAITAHVFVDTVGPAMTALCMPAHWTALQMECATTALGCVTVTTSFPEPGVRSAFV